MGSVRVREGTIDDLDAWFELREAVAAEGIHIGAEAPLDRAANEAVYRGWLETGTRCVLLAVEDGDDAHRDVLVGSLGARLEQGVVELGMWVAAGRRGQGIGRRLLDACVAWAREQGAHKVALEAWPHNAAALRLYERAGFVVEGRLRRRWRRRDGSLWDAVVMGLVLDTTSPGSPYPDAV